MAEGLADAYAASRGRDILCRSAGTLGIVARPADPKAVAVCADMGVDISHHLSQGLDEELVEWAEFVLVMEFHHAQLVREHYPDVGDKLLLLGTFGGMGEIPDPIGGWRFRFRRSRDDIRRCVEGFVDRLPHQP